MTCRRAPEFAAGQFLELVQRLLEISAASLLFDLAADQVLGADQAIILRDFVIARRYPLVDSRAIRNCTTGVRCELQGVRDSCVCSHQWACNVHVRSSKRNV